MQPGDVRAQPFQVRAVLDGVVRMLVQLSVLGDQRRLLGDERLVFGTQIKDRHAISTGHGCRESSDC